MRFLSKLDDKGMEIQRTSFNVVGARRGDDEYRIKYDSYDGHGNWTKKTTSKLVEHDGKKAYDEWYVTYRTIEYY